MSPKVLIVDDSRLARMSVVRALTRLYPDLNCLEAGHADQALAIVEDHNVQAAIIDFNMPGRDGLELAAELRAKMPEISLAILSANAQSDIIATAESLGAVFLLKPLNEPALARFLEVAISRDGG